MSVNALVHKLGQLRALGSVCSTWMADGFRPGPDMFLFAFFLVLLVNPKLLSWNSSAIGLERKATA